VDDLARLLPSVPRVENTGGLDILGSFSCICLASRLNA